MKSKSIDNYTSFINEIDELELSDMDMYEIMNDEVTVELSLRDLSFLEMALQALDLKSVFRIGQELVDDDVMPEQLILKKEMIKKDVEQRKMELSLKFLKVFNSAINEKIQKRINNRF